MLTDADTHGQSIFEEMMLLRREKDGSLKRNVSPDALAWVRRRLSQKKHHSDITRASQGHNRRIRPHNTPSQLGLCCRASGPCTC
jgi:hypothetical protein